MQLCTLVLVCLAWQGAWATTTSSTVSSTDAPSTTTEPPATSTVSSTSTEVPTTTVATTTLATTTEATTTEATTAMATTAMATTVATSSLASTSTSGPTTSQGSTTSAGSTSTQGSTSTAQSSSSPTTPQPTSSTPPPTSTTPVGTTTSGPPRPTFSPTPNPNPTPCEPGSVADRSNGIECEFEFNLVHSAFDCVGMVSAFRQLWSEPTHTITLLGTRAGSVIATFHVGDPGNGEALARYNQLTTELADPGSTTSIFANNLGIPVIRSSTVAPGSSGGGVPIGLIVAAAIGGIIVIIVAIIVIVFCCRRYQNKSNDRYTPLMTMNSSSSSSSSSGGSLSASQHEIGTPYGFAHGSGDSKAASNLVSRESFARRQNPAAQVDTAPRGGGHRKAKLIADIRDVGQGVLTGAKMGSLVRIEEKDWTDGDWVWATIDGRQGWCPKNHLQLE